MVSKAFQRIAGNDYVSYLRVSSKSQVETDYDPQGISLPAQRLAVDERGAELGARRVEEFIDPGRSGKTIDQGPDFQKMIAYLKAHPNVRYVIVYALSRFARNRLDDAIMMATLEGLGVRLISATERNIDDSPAGRMMHGILAVFNEYQVLQSGEDIRYKMGQKAKHGGTVTKAPFGYRNVRVEYEGREIRTVVIDEDYSPYVKMAFELYATGQYSFPDIRDALTDAGLLMPGNRRRGKRPISIHKIGDMLRDRYYIGFVRFDGIEYEGRHETFIDPELFERVQRVLYVERNAGTRQRHHDHYLKGSLWCHRSRHRVVLRPSTGKSGRQYFYFICRGLVVRECDLPSIPVAEVERAVEAHYATIGISASEREAIERLALAAVRGSQESAAAVRTQLTKRLVELDAEEDRYLDCLGDPAWPQAKLKARLQRVREDIAGIRRQLEAASSDLTTGHEVLLATLELLERPRELYRRAKPRVRKVLNRAIFGRLYLDYTDGQVRVPREELRQPFEAIVTAHKLHLGIRTSAPLKTDKRNGAPTNGSADTCRISTLTPVSAGQGANNGPVVELRGFEPLTPSMRTRCATGLRHSPMNRVQR